MFAASKFKQIKKADEPIYSVPKSIQEEIQVLKVDENGIFQISKDSYSKCYVIEDINVLIQGDDEVVSVLDKYCMMLNSLDVSIKIVLFNKNQNMKYVEKNALYQLQNDKDDMCREAFNELMMDGIVNENKGVECEKYLVVTVKRDTYIAAKTALGTIEGNLAKYFGSMKSSITPCNATQRFKILRDFFRMGEEEKELPEFKEYISSARDWKNDIACGLIKFSKDGQYFETDYKHGQALYVSDYPNNLGINFINKISSEPINSVIAIDIVPVPHDVAVKFVEEKYMSIEKKIEDQQRIRNKNKSYSSDISYKVRMEKKDVQEVLDDLYEGDQKMFLGSVNIIVLADDKDELISSVERIKSLVEGFGCSLKVNELRQREAINTVLPYGCRQIDNQRTMLTRDLAALMPFAVQELWVHSKKGFNIFYGRNQVSRRNLYGNRKSLINGNGLIFGVTGSGKSVDAKSEMVSVYLNSDDDIIIIDPTLEYKDLADKFNGSFLEFSTESKNYINPLDIDLENITEEAINAKTEFMLALLSNCMKEILSARHMSIISRCLKMIYLRLAELPLNKRRQPTMTDMWNVLEQFEEPEAKYLHLSMEIFVDGALNMFNNQTNISIDKRLTVYGIRDMSESLSASSVLCIIENITKKLKENFAKNKTTWLYIDELHILLNKEYSMDYLMKLWVTVRKLGGMCTGITQNISLMVNHPKTIAILGNSEFIMLLNQSKMDIEKVCENVNGMTPAYLDYVFNASPGTGLLKHGNVIVPFDNTIKKENILYDLFNTDLHEKAALEKLKNY